MAASVALVTPSHQGDFERFALLCESLDRYVRGFERHYVLVADDDAPLFATLANERRIVLPASSLLPRWLRLAPRAMRRRGRRVWWSLRARPVHGWHVQQILKITAAATFAQQRYCMIDSDNVFIRPFDIGAFAGGALSPLYVDRAAIGAEAPLHAVWTRNCDRLLGQGPTPFPADDYIGQIVVWDQDAAADMTKAIARATGRQWALALCRTRAFSEYLLYGHFVMNAPAHRARHALTSDGLASVYWGDEPLESAALAQMIESAPASHAALSVASISHTPVSRIRDAIAARPAPGPAPAKAFA